MLKIGSMFQLTALLALGACATDPGYVMRNTKNGDTIRQKTMSNADVLARLPGRWATVPRDRALFPREVYECNGSALSINPANGGVFEAVSERTQEKFRFRPRPVDRKGGERLQLDFSPVFGVKGSYLITMNAVNEYLVVRVPHSGNRMRALERCA
jgi:hypothetical protein